MKYEPHIKIQKNGIRTLIGVRTGHCLIGWHARLKTPYNDSCRSCQKVEEEETIKHLLRERKALYKKKIATIGQGFLGCTDKTFCNDKFHQKHGVVRRGYNRVKES